ncbi:MAG TPA: hypothetical protein VKO66_08190, partial [Sideroxyarcus sp.]|nr:hypothetical protein [Sideroxyarcus sp.]
MSHCDIGAPDQGRFLQFSALFYEPNCFFLGWRWRLPLPRHILSVAPNCCLRYTREEIFKAAGYAVTSVPSTSDALQQLSGTGDAFDIVVVCDCTPADDRARLVATLKVTSPAIPALLVGV